MRLKAGITASSDLTGKHFLDLHLLVTQRCALHALRLGMRLECFQYRIGASQSGIGSCRHIRRVIAKPHRGVGMPFTYNRLVALLDRHLTKNGLLHCRRIESLTETAMLDEPESVIEAVVATQDPEQIFVPGSLVVCPFCHKASTIEHHDGEWCSNCGRFARPPDPKLLPSLQKGYKEPEHERYEPRSTITGSCSACHYSGDMSDGF